MFSIKNILRSITNPRKIGREANKQFHTRFGQYQFNPNGTCIFEEDWDNLIILDACRYDYFAEQADLPGRMEHRESVGSATYHWVRGTFAGKTLHDTVYVGANTWFLKLRDEIDAEIYDFVDLQHGDYDVEWINEELRVVTPGTVTNVALETVDKYPNKRHIIHYLQPHHPFIGSTGGEYFDHESSSLLDVVDESGAGDELLRQAYRENLEAVLPEVKRLLNSLSGRTVVTADHGEMLGDRHEYVPARDYGHHPGIFNNATVKVPWLIYESGERRHIVADTPTKQETDMDKIDKQLRDLGYKT